MIARNIQPKKNQKNKTSSSCKIMMLLKNLELTEIWIFYNILFPKRKEKREINK